MIEQVRNRQVADKLKGVSTQTKQMLKSQANDNAKQVVSSTKPTVSQTKTFVMHSKFEIQHQRLDQLKSVIEEVDEKQKKKQEILDRIRKERLEKAKLFRENERDL